MSSLYYFSLASSFNSAQRYSHRTLGHSKFDFSFPSSNFEIFDEGAIYYHYPDIIKIQKLW